MKAAGISKTGKNIVVFSDGTGQEGGEGNNSNVYKLFQMVEDRTDEQIAFYDPGLGTGWKKVTGNIAGAGISKNILECYQFISDNYKWGDRIFLFGFSRGAATVRSLAGFISRFGILPHSRPDLPEKAWKIYQNTDRPVREIEAKQFINRNSTTWCNIEFLGAWDTVAALGVPIKGLNGALNRVPFFKHSFHDLKLSRCVRHARHALSIDENRKDFSLTPWQTEENGQSLLGEVYVDPRSGLDGGRTGKIEQQSVRQVWFSGVHTDVGGGYVSGGLSNITLAWMIDEATDTTLLSYPLKLYPYTPVELNQDHKVAIHNERDTWLKKKVFRKRQRTWDTAKGGKPVIHASVLERRGLQVGKDGDPYEPWILKQFSAQDYEIEPWNNKSTLYSIPIETDYRFERDPDGKS